MVQPVRFKQLFVLTQSFYCCHDYVRLQMEQSRRRFLLASVALGTPALSGCVAGNSGGRGDENRDGNDDSPCEIIDLPLVDEPPHEIVKPPQPADHDDADGWNEHYLGEGIDDASDLSFDPISLRFSEPIVDLTTVEGDGVYYADLFTSRERVEEELEWLGDESTARLDDVDFDEQSVVVVLSGLGSSSITHEWVRLEHHCEELHLHGYYSIPPVRTSDVTARTSGLVVEKPAQTAVERLWVSLTVSENRRVNVASDDDIRTVETNGDTEEGNDADGSGGTVDGVTVVPATRDGAGDWDGDGLAETGILVYLENETQVQSLLYGQDVDRFVEGTNFETDAVFYLESAGPNACYRTVEVSDVVIETDNGDHVVFGTAAVRDDSPDGGGCAEVITYPGILIRVERAGEATTGEFRITDGWERTSVVRSKSIGDHVRE